MPHRNLHKAQATLRAKYCQALRPVTLYTLEFLIGQHTLPAMTPSEDDVTNFLAFAPEAGEGKAFLFLEVSHPLNLAYRPH